MTLQNLIDNRSNDKFVLIDAGTKAVTQVRSNGSFTTPDGDGEYYPDAVTLVEVGEGLYGRVDTNIYWQVVRDDGRIGIATNTLVATPGVDYALDPTIQAVRIIAESIHVRADPSSSAQYPELLEEMEATDEMYDEWLEMISREWDSWICRAFPTQITL